VAPDFLNSFLRLTAMKGLNTRLPLVGMAMVALSVAACKGKEAESATPTTPPSVAVGPENIAVVTEGELSAGPAISGALGPEREAMVRAQVPGAVMKVNVDQGMRVRAGQSLAQIDDRTLRDAFLSARSGFNTAQNAAERAKRDLQRMERLAQAGAIAERDLETARLSSTGAESQLADAQARLTMAQKQLDDAQIRAPFSGVVSVRSVSEGDVVAPGAALFSIVDPASMRFEASVPAAQLSQVKVGAPVTFTVSGYPDRRFTGRVARINPTVEAGTGQVRIVVSVPNASSNLVSGLFADGRIATERRKGMTSPYAAVDMRGLKPTVLRLKGGVAERVEVQLGVRDEDLERYEILSGVAAGDTLLIGAAQGITPGTVVRVSTPSDQPPAK
jgi:membrane fusion protein (multidrug efflux system)